MKINFSRGRDALNKLPLFNYQLNRLVAWGGVAPSALAENTQKITDFISWEQILKEIAQKALLQEDWKTAIGCMRSAEFFMVPGTKESMETYDQARKLFYQHYSKLFTEDGGPISLEHVAYEGSSLPCWHISCSENCKGTILFHGGNDSLIEEFWMHLLYLSKAGYEVIGFEGPGQGEVLRKGGLPFTPNWEKPVKCILEHYHIQEAVLIGVSLGAELAMRAAALESRIKKVVAWCTLPDLYDTLMSDKPVEVREKLEQWLADENKQEVVALYQNMAHKIPLLQWSINHCNYACGTETVYEYLQQVKEYSIKPVAN